MSVISHINLEPTIPPDPPDSVTTSLARSDSCDFPNPRASRLRIRRAKCRSFTCTNLKMAGLRHAATECMWHLSQAL